MKRIALTAAMILALGFGIWGSCSKKPAYGNISFSVWRLDSDYGNLNSAIKAPVEKSIKESWIFETVSFISADKDTNKKAFTKKDLTFYLIMESDEGLLIKISEKGEHRFTFKHHKASSASYIFHGIDFVPYLIRVTFTTGDHPIGIIGPGIRKISNK